MERGLPTRRRKEKEEEVETAALSFQCTLLQDRLNFGEWGEEREGPSLVRRRS